MSLSNKMLLLSAVALVTNGSSGMQANFATLNIGDPVTRPYHRDMLQLLPPHIGDVFKSRINVGEHIGRLELCNYLKSYGFDLSDTTVENSTELANWIVLNWEDIRQKIDQLSDLYQQTISYSFNYRDSSSYKFFKAHNIFSFSDIKNVTVRAIEQYNLAAEKPICLTRQDKKLLSKLMQTLDMYMDCLETHLINAIGTVTENSDILNEAPQQPRLLPVPQISLNTQFSQRQRQPLPVPQINLDAQSFQSNSNEAPQQPPSVPVVLPPKKRHLQSITY